MMNDKELFQMILKNASDALGVPENVAAPMMIMAASTLPTDVIKTLASLAKRQNDGTR